MAGERISKIPLPLLVVAQQALMKKYRQHMGYLRRSARLHEKAERCRFRFCNTERLLFLDIDHRPLTDPFVQMLLERFNSYTERSVSGKGIHIYGKCDFEKLPTYADKNGNPRLDKAYYMKNPNNHLELYVGGLTNRFAAYTGDVILNEPLKESTAAILLTLDKNMRKSKKQDTAKNVMQDPRRF